MVAEEYVDGASALLEHEDTEALVWPTSGARAGAATTASPLGRRPCAPRTWLLPTILVGMVALVLLARTSINTTRPAAATPTGAVSRIEVGAGSDDKEGAAAAAGDKEQGKGVIVTEVTAENSGEDDNETDKVTAAKGEGTEEDDGGDKDAGKGNATEAAATVEKDEPAADASGDSATGTNTHDAPAPKDEVAKLVKLAGDTVEAVQAKRAGGDKALVQKQCNPPDPLIVEEVEETQGGSFCCFSGTGAPGTPDFCNGCFPGARAAPGTYCDQSQQNCVSGGGQATWCGAAEPEAPASPPGKSLKVLPPTSQCSTVEDDCKETKCCQISGKTCYKKNNFFAGCLDTGTCVKGPEWDCAPLINDNSVPNSPRGYVSLYCWSVIRTTGYEPSLVRTQLAKGVSIFGCDAWTVLSEESIWLRPGGASDDNSTALPAAAKTESKLGGGSDATTSWVNANTFLLAWDTIGKMKKYAKNDWIVKVDPDAVLLPSRLRDQLKIFGAGGKLYFTNCKGVRHGLYGSIEVISKEAVETYISGMEKCSTKLPYKQWGEDRFTESCMEVLKIGHIDNFCLASDGCCGKILEHGVCKHALPCVTGEAAFHPFKDVKSWFTCLAEATEDAA